MGGEIFDCAYQLSRLKDRSIATAELATLLGDVERYLGEIFTKLPEDKKAYPPLEEILTLLWDCKSSERYDHEKKKRISLFKHPDGARGLFEAFAKLLGLTLAGALQLNETSSRIEQFGNFIKALLSDRKQNISFISLNYDVLLDNILAECVNDGVIADYSYGVPLSDIEEPYRSGSKQKFCRDTGVLLLKPHGSLNLVSCPHHQARYGDGFYYSKANPIAVIASTLKCPGCGSVPKPLIIPPLYNKSEYIAASAVKTRHLVSWRSSPELFRTYCDPEIRETLGLADEITIIGYSLPAYDYDFKGLLITSLMKNTKRRKIRLKLITKGDDAVCNLKRQCEPLVGPVTVESSDGFYNYLKGSLPAAV